MSDRKDREYSTIIKGLQSAEEILENLKKDAQMLKTEADTASTELKDRVGQKDTKALKDLAETILDAAKSGIERIRELEQKMQKQNDRFEQLL